jgi:uncharacterized protein (DUF302 family)
MEDQSMKGFILGIVVGAVGMGILVWKQMPSMMLIVHESKLPFEETVSAIEESAKTHGWNVPKIYDIQKSVEKEGHDDLGPVKIISLCQPHHAYRILKHDEHKKVSAIMPCRIGVFAADDGAVHIAEMNMSLMSKLFGGLIAEIMGGVASEEKAILADIVKPEE